MGNTQDRPYIPYRPYRPYLEHLLPFEYTFGYPGESAGESYQSEDVSCVPKSTANLIEYDIDSFAEKVMDTKHKFDVHDQFNTLFEEFKRVQSIYESNTYENFAEIKRQLDIHREKYKEKIDDIYMAMIRETEECEKFFQDKLKQTQHMNLVEQESRAVDYKASFQSLQTKLGELKFISSQMAKCSFEAKQDVDKSTFGILNLRRLKRNLVSCSDSTIKVWDMEANTSLKTLFHTATIRCLEALSDGRIASGSDDGCIKVWNIEDGVCTNTLTGHNMSVTCLKVLPSAQIASGSWMEIKVWDINSGECVLTLIGCHNMWVTSLTVLPDLTLVSASGDTTISFWNIASEDINKIYTRTSYGHTDSVNCLLLLTNGRLASGSTDRTIKIWNAESGVCIKTLVGHTHAIWKLESTDKHDLISCSSDKTIKILDITSGACVKNLFGLNWPVISLHKYTNDLVLSGSCDAKIRVWDLTSGKCVQIFTEHLSAINALIFV